MLYEEGLNEIKFTQDTIAGNFIVKLTLTDDNENDPKSTVYFFEVLITDKEQVAEQEQIAEQEQATEQEQFAELEKEKESGE